MRQALAIRHVGFEDLGNLLEVLQQRAFDIKYVEAARDDLKALDPLSPDLLIILGGPIGVYEASVYPFLGDELRILEKRLAADLPTLGICLGAQLIARALDASVYPGQHKELGWAPLQLQTAGEQSPLHVLSAAGTSVLHWHGDTFDLPVGSTLLASTPLYAQQAFSWGRSCLALQFHLEVTVAGLEQWFVGHAVEINQTPNVSVEQLRRDTGRYGPMLQARAATCWETWLDHVLPPVPGWHSEAVSPTANASA